MQETTTHTKAGLKKGLRIVCLATLNRLMWLDVFDGDDDDGRCWKVAVVEVPCFPRLADNWYRTPGLS